MFNSKIATLAILLVSIAAWTGTATADVTNITVSADTFLVAGDPNNNAGAHTATLSGTSGFGSPRRGLFKFDVSGIPSGANITSAVFQVSVVGQPSSGGVNSTFDVFQLTASWNEGDKSGSHGSAASTGEATWNSRFSGQTNWTSGGASGNFLTNSLGSAAISGLGSYTWTSAQLASLVQSWLANPATNAGLILITRSEATAKTARQFGSREGGSPAILTIGYEVPPPPISSGATIPASADTFILANAATNNAGAHDSVNAGANNGPSPRRGLFRFDLSSIPAGAVVTSAIFNLSVIGVPGGGGSNSTFDILPFTAAWNEGTKAGELGSDATAGETTWNSQFVGITNWGTPGASGNYLTNSLGSAAITGTGAYSWTSAQLITLVQSWISNPATNMGVILITRSESTPQTARRFGSREGGMPATLVIGYNHPGSPPEAVMGGVTAFTTNFSLQWSASTSLLYDVEYSDNLNNPWKLAEPGITPSSGSHTWSEPPYSASPSNANNTRTMYRVRSRLKSNALPIALTPIITNLTSPVHLTHAGDGTRRMFIVDQTGIIRVVQSNVVLATPFLNISSKLVSLSPGYDERGLLGMAFHPDYETNGYFYVYYSAPTNSGNHESIVARYSVSATANVANAESELVILRVNQPESNHNGGALAFGADGYLYIALGDGGGSGDQHGTFGNAQNLNTLLGKIVRIDVNSGSPYSSPTNNPLVGQNGMDEIYAWGFRNPFRISFDRLSSNDLYVADVGQNLWEEINLVQKGSNYGWRILEGGHLYDAAIIPVVGTNVSDLAPPIHEYRHGSLGTTVIGGYRYHGPFYPALQGCYVFGDFSTSFGSPAGILYYLQETSPGRWDRFPFTLVPAGPLGEYIKGFGEDEDGELYVLTSDNVGPSGSVGKVFRLTKP